MNHNGNVPYQMTVRTKKPTTAKKKEHLHVAIR